MNNSENKHLQIIKSSVDSNTWVIKVGSAMITDNGRGVDRILINNLAYQIDKIRKQGKHVILVSSGAIATGIRRLNWTKKPSDLPSQQAAAAVGQMTLSRIYEEIFQNYGIQTAQVLLTHEDASDRKRYLNIRSTLLALLENDILPIINENDTVSFDEIKFGDNDNLGALVANLTHAGLYIILTDQKGIYDSDPRHNPNAKLVSFAPADDKLLDSYIGKSISSVGSGGMLTKIQAARKAANSNTATVIAHGKADNVLISLLKYVVDGSFLYAEHAVNAKKQWLAGQIKTKGSIRIDAGASTALITKGKSLLAKGIIDAKGDFSRGEIIDIVNDTDKIIARGITNYNFKEVQLIKGVDSKNFTEKLGYSLEKEVIHRDDLALIDY